jgi:hypothetical protein
MSLSYLDDDGEQVEIPLSEVEAKCEEGVLEDGTQVSGVGTVVNGYVG